MPAKQRISYVPLDDMTPEMRKEMERCAREGTPRPESSAIRAHVPAAFWFFAEDNLEILLKILDGTAVNGRHWVFYASLSNVRFTVTITDTESGW